MGFVQLRHDSGSLSGGTTFSSGNMPGVAAGHLLVAVIVINGVGFGSNQPTAVSDTLGNTYSNTIGAEQMFRSNGNLFSGIGIALWYKANAAGGTGSLNVTLLAGLSGGWDIFWYEYSNIILVSAAVGYNNDTQFTLSGANNTTTTAVGASSSNTIVGIFLTGGSNMTTSSLTTRASALPTYITGDQASTAAGGETLTFNSSSTSSGYISMFGVFANVPVTHTISGSTGVAGSIVTWVDTTTLASGSVTSDGSGNYTITGLIQGDTFEVGIYDPALGSTFVPGAAFITLSADTVQDFTPTAVVPLTCTSVQIGADTFTRANENPLNPAVWQQFGGYAPLQIISNRVTGTVPSGPFPGTFNAEQFIATWPTNVYGQITVNVLTADGASTVGIDFRSDSTGSNAFAAAIIRNLDGTFQIIVEDLGNPTQGLFIYSYAATLGDVFRFELSGATVRFLRNGVLIAIGDLGNSGTYGAFGDVNMEGKTVVTDAQASNFSFGSLTCTGGGGASNRVWVSPLIISSIEKGNAL